MLGALLLAAASVLGGSSLTFLYLRRSSIVERICQGTAIGFILLGLYGFILASVLGFSVGSVVLAGILTVAPVLLFRRAWIRELAAQERSNLRTSLGKLFARPVRIDRVVSAILLAGVCLTVLVIAAQSAYLKGGELTTAIESNLGDLPFHVGIINGFYRGENFPPQDPEYAGARLTYPFLVDFVAAMMLRVGAPLEMALVLQSSLLLLAIVGLMGAWASRLSPHPLAPALAALLLIFSGGMGWLDLISEVAKDGWNILQHLPHDYTISFARHLRWGNSLTVLLMPQRSLLLGVPIFLAVVTAWWDALRPPAEATKASAGDPRGKKGSLRKNSAPLERNEPASTDRSWIVGTGILTGLLPLAHTYTFVVLVAAGTALALVYRKGRPLLVTVAVACLLGLPQLAWLSQGTAVHASSFLDWHLGWDREDQNVLRFLVSSNGLEMKARLLAQELWNATLFWLWNTGPLLPLMLWGNGLVPRGGRRFFLPFWLCFLIPNVLRMAPWIWDNIKILYFWYLALVPLAVLGLLRIARLRAIGPVLCGIAVICMTLAGGLDLWRVESHASEQRIFDLEGVELADRIIRLTPPRALILHAPTYNHPIQLTGRASLLGYPGHLWSRGLDSSDRQRDLEEMYRGGPQAASLIDRYHVEYVITGSRESSPELPIDEEFFTRYRKIAATRNYNLYQIHP